MDSPYESSGEEIATTRAHAPTLTAADRRELYTSQLNHAAAAATAERVRLFCSTVTRWIDEYPEHYYMPNTDLVKYLSVGQIVLYTHGVPTDVITEMTLKCKDLGYTTSFAPGEMSIYDPKIATSVVPLTSSDAPFYMVATFIVFIVIVANIASLF